jgi:BUD22
MALAKGPEKTAWDSVHGKRESACPSFSLPILSSDDLHCRLWEKKYGKGAHHVQRQFKEQRVDERWQERREKWASGGNAAAGNAPQRAWGDKPTQSQVRRRPDAREDNRAGRPPRRPDAAATPAFAKAGVAANAGPAKAGAQHQAEHPSWVAKQKQKEKEAMMAKPQGKKIVFD